MGYLTSPNFRHLKFFLFASSHQLPACLLLPSRRYRASPVGTFHLRDPHVRRAALQRDPPRHRTVRPSDVLQYSFPNPFERQDKSAEKGDLHVVLLQNYPLPTINSTHPLLRRITHLELEEPIKPGASQPISVMPNLTHLAVLIRITEGGLGWIFDMISGTSIKVFALIWDQWISGRDLRAIEAWLRKSRRKGDERIYMVWRNEIPSVDWDNEVCGGKTIWERAVEGTEALMSQPDPDPVNSARLDEEDARREWASHHMPAGLPPELLRVMFLQTAELSTASCCTFCDLLLDPPHCPARSVPAPSSRNLTSLVLHHNVTHLAIHQSDLVRVFSAITPSPLERQDSHGGARAHVGKGNLHVVLIRNYRPSHGSGIHRLFRRITRLCLEEPIMLGWQATRAMSNLTPSLFPDGIKREEIENWVRKSRKGNEWIYVVWQQERLEVEWNTETRGGTVIWEKAAKQTQLLMHMSWDPGIL
ncbi:hypothetical protein BD779DRAFT_1698886 [Infundibulicybe gibba]|nr:hypothetical protein BD779DRAFT_1698886 [Infundibulicybe gibba]